MACSALSDRIACDVPACKRTIAPERYRRLFGREPGGWICGACWRKVPRSLKRVKARHEREFRRHGFYPREAAYRRTLQAIWRAAFA